MGAHWKLRLLLSFMALEILLLLGEVAPSSAQTFTVLHTFTFGADGGSPYAGLIQDGSGNVYGTTLGGGSDGGGVVFEVDASGTETVLHTFSGYNGTGDGATPDDALVRDDAGNLYGTTFYGGLKNCSAGSCGVVFKIDSTGTETILHSFAGGTADGCNPWGGVIRDDVGNLYGTTAICGSSGWGTVWKLDKNGKETILHSFAGTDGAHPNSGNLLMDRRGNLYGVTEEGGSANEGVVYKLTKSGRLTVLHSFTGHGTPDGCIPIGTLVMDAEGSLYGVTGACGGYGYGIVWKLDKNRRETILHTFLWSASDGAYPFGGVVLDSQGNLYGTTGRGGSGDGDGTVYKLSKDGTMNLLHTFSVTDGYYPHGELVRAANGGLYGTCALGGDNGGTVWSLK